MVINHNMSSLFASRQEGITTASLQSSMEKLSSGEKINRAEEKSKDKPSDANQVAQGLIDLLV